MVEFLTVSLETCLSHESIMHIVHTTLQLQSYKEKNFSKPEKNYRRLSKILLLTAEKFLITDNSDKMANIKVPKFCHFGFQEEVQIKQYISQNVEDT